MFYYVKVSGDQIILSGSSSIPFELPSDLVEVPEDIFERIKAIPCTCTIVGGIITDVETIEVIPNPKPKTEVQVLQERILDLEGENADLWYDSMIKDMKIGATESEIAQLWYEIMMGGI